MSRKTIARERYAALVAANVHTRLFGPGLRQCRATVRNGERKGQKCRQPAVTGSPVCRFHGAGGDLKVREYLARKRLKRSPASDYYWAVRWPKKLARLEARAVARPPVDPKPVPAADAAAVSGKAALLAVCMTAAEYGRYAGLARRPMSSGRPGAPARKRPASPG